MGCYFLCPSMYVKAANITNSKVKTSMVVTGITLLCKTRGRF